MKNIKMKKEYEKRRTQNAETRKTEYDQKRMQNAEIAIMNYRGTDPESLQLIKRAMEKANKASSWLSALPIKLIRYAPNKQEFTDSTCMRYGW